ncbi:Chromatin assembly factor 1 subunit B [Aphelenchoides avenae]|nr:Chromatin assembly factor 1 subunit B [Aphelenchus avenae]
MQHYMPCIFWHDKEAILCVDVLQKHLSPSTASGRSSQSLGKGTDVYRIVTASVQKEVRIWEFRLEPLPVKESVKQLSVDFIANLLAHHKTVNIVRWSPDGELIASGDVDGFLYVWKVQPQGNVDETEGGDESEEDAKSDKSEKKDDLPPNKENWQRLRLPIRHDSDVTALAWSPQDYLIASASTDESVSVHNATTGRRIWSTRGLRNYVNGIAWDPRGKYVVTLSTDRRWDVLDAAKGTRLRCAHHMQLPSTVIGDCTLPEESYKLFHDDQLVSFIRYPEFSPCGEVLFAPVAHLEVGENNLFGTYVFKRADFDKCRPTGLLPSLKPTIMVKCSPVIYELRTDIEENFLGLPYRLIYAVMCKECVLLYDSQRSEPIGFVDNLHYFDLTSISWTPDGKVLVVSSQEGFNSFLAFDGDTFGVPTVLPQRDASQDEAKLVPIKKKKIKEDVISPQKPPEETEKTPKGTPTVTPSGSEKKAASQASTPKTNNAAKTLFAFWGKTPKADLQSPPSPLKPMETEAKKEKEEEPSAAPPARVDPPGKKRVQLITLED